MELDDFDIVITQAATNTAYVYCKSPNIKTAISHLFRFRPKNFQFSPIYKRKDVTGARLWDGWINLFNAKTSQLPLGLLPNLIEYAKSINLTYKIDDGLIAQKSISPAELKEFIQSLGVPLTMKDYQISAIYQAINHKRMIVVSVTSSGKSLIIYALCKWLVKQNHNVLITVDGSLWSQLLGDFIDYGHDLKTDKINVLAGSESIDHKSNVTIATWQSLKNQEPEYFKKFTAVLTDEVHQYKAKSMTYIMNNLINTQYRVGFTGTMHETMEDISIQALFGKVVQVSTYNRLINEKTISTIGIQAIVLRYSHDFMIKFIEDQLKLKRNENTYQREIKFLYKYTKRLAFLISLAKKIGSDGSNILILTSMVDGLGKPLFEHMTRLLPDHKVFFVDKNTKTKDRDKIRAFLETNEKCIVISTYQIYSKGINIKNLQKCIFASGTKSLIRICQSIGRTLRLDGKHNQAVIYDIVDDLRIKNKKGNYVNFNHSYKHFLERYQIYMNKEFPVTMSKHEL